MVIFYISLVMLNFQRVVILVDRFYTPEYITERTFSGTAKSDGSGTWIWLFGDGYGQDGRPMRRSLIARNGCGSNTVRHDGQCGNGKTTR